MRARCARNALRTSATSLPAARPPPPPLSPRGHRRPPDAPRAGRGLRALVARRRRPHPSLSPRLPPLGPPESPPPPPKTALATPFAPLRGEKRCDLQRLCPPSPCSTPR